MQKFPNAVSSASFRLKRKAKKGQEKFENPVWNEEGLHFVKITVICKVNVFFFDNNEDAKLMKVSFPILASFLKKRKVWRDNSKFNQVSV